MTVYLGPETACEQEGKSGGSAGPWVETKGGGGEGGEFVQCAEVRIRPQDSLLTVGMEYSEEGCCSGSRNE